MKTLVGKIKHDLYCECGICNYCEGIEDVYGKRIKPTFAEIEAEVERLKMNENSLLNAIADWYYSHKDDNQLSKAYENFLTFGQGGANFKQSQELAKRGEKK